MRKILLIAAVLAAACMVVLNLAYDPLPEADEVFPMANRFIEWSYAGK